MARGAPTGGRNQSYAVFFLYYLKKKVGDSQIGGEGAEKRCAYGTCPTAFYNPYSTTSLFLFLPHRALLGVSPCKITVVKMAVTRNYGLDTYLLHILVVPKEEIRKRFK